MNVLSLSTQLAAIKIQLTTLFDDCGGDAAIELLDALSQLEEDDQRAAIEVFLGAVGRIAEKSRALQRSGKGRVSHNRSENEYERLASALCEEIIDSLGLRRDVEACLPDREADDRGFAFTHLSQNKRIRGGRRGSNSNIKNPDEKRRANRRASFSDETNPERHPTSVKQRRASSQSEGLLVSAADTTDAAGLESSAGLESIPPMAVTTRGNGKAVNRGTRNKKSDHRAQIYVLPRTSV